MLYWIASLLNSAVLAWNVYMLIRTWWHYWRRQRKYFFTKYMAPSVQPPEGSHFVPYEGIRVANEMRKNDRQYARSTLRSNWLISLLWIGLIVYLYLNFMDIERLR